MKSENVLLNATATTTTTTTSSYNINNNNESSISFKSIALLLAIFIGSIFLLYLVYLSFPNLEENEKQYIKLPKNIADAKQLGIVLKKYSQDHYYSVLAAVFLIYVFLQSFAIPGSLFLTILAGFLYPFPIALFLVCLCSAFGATFCYLLSYIVAKRIVKKYFYHKITEWQRQANKQKENMLFYIIFLRITPFVPNWFMNLSSPLIDIPLKPFVLGTFLGVAPPCCIYIQAGTTLNTLTSSSSVFTWQSVLMLTFFSIVSLSPVFFKNQIKKNIE